VRQAERVAALFLPAGNPIYIWRDSEGEEEETNVPGGDDTLDAPLVVLVNEGTASSAEILAGALKENGRARLVGERTSGIGTVIEDYL
jgi:carboxyl-terminal processing protease